MGRCSKAKVRFARSTSQMSCNSTGDAVSPPTPTVIGTVGVDLVDRPRLSPGRHIDDRGCFREILREGRLHYIGVTRHVIPSDPWCWLLPSRGQLSARRRSTEAFRISMITRTPSSYCEQSSRNTDETTCNDVAEKMDIHCHESDIGSDNANCP